MPLATASWSLITFLRATLRAVVRPRLRRAVAGKRRRVHSSRLWIYSLKRCWLRGSATSSVIRQLRASKWRRTSDWAPFRCSPLQTRDCQRVDCKQASKLGRARQQLRSWLLDEIR